MLMEGPTSAKLRKAQLSACPNTSALLTYVEVRMTYTEKSAVARPIWSIKCSAQPAPAT